MENRMDRPEQPPATPEQLHFRRITWSMFLLGIMIGILIALYGALEYLQSGAIPYAFYPNSPIIYRLPGPLLGVSLGIIYLLIRRIRLLRRQHPAFQPGRFDPLNHIPWPATTLSFGLLFIWLGAANVILISFNPDPYIWSIVEMAGTTILVLAIFAELLLPLLRQRTTKPIQTP